jgi:hypothetical protein
MFQLFDCHHHHRQVYNTKTSKNVHNFTLDFNFLDFTPVDDRMIRKRSV